jgi:membrane protease YdiL (CAAX protease family)
VTANPDGSGHVAPWPGHLPTEPPPTPPASARRGIAVPRGVVKLAVAAMLVGYVLSIVGAIAGSLAFRSSGVVAVALSSIGLYATLLGMCRWVSRRYGSGSVRADLGLAFDRRDMLSALGYALAARAGILVVSIVLYVIYRPLARGNLQGLDLKKDIAATVVLAIIAVGVAPVCEELFFRGLLLRALTGATSRRAALGVQALLFGVMHAGGYGLGNVGVVLSTCVVGVVLGHVVERQGRLGTAVLTHAIHNAASLLLVLLVIGA